MKPASVILYAFLFIVISILFGCGGDNAYLDQIVARVGDETISFKDLQTSFELEPKYITRTPLRTARQNQLDHLVDQKYYYLAANQMGLVEEPLIDQRITYIQNTEILKALINEKYLNAVKLGPETVRNGLNRAAERRRVQNYFTHDAQAAEDYQKRLQNNSLDTELFFETEAQDLGYVSFGDLDQTIEDAVYDLDTLTISKVIKSRYGYHILRVTDITENMDFKNLNDRMRLQNSGEIIRKRLADERIRESLKAAAGDDKIQINNRMVDALLIVINQYIEGQSEDPTIIAPPISNRELKNIDGGLKEIYDKPLVRFKDEEITVQAFIKRIQDMPPFHRPYLSGRNFLVRSLLDMMRNDLLLAEAIRDGYGEKESVVETYQKQIKDYLAREFGLRLNSNIFKEENPQAWQAYEHAYQGAKEDYELSFDEGVLFHDVKDPDSIMTKAPVQVFLKNKYIW